MAHLNSNQLAVQLLVYSIQEHKLQVRLAAKLEIKHPLLAIPPVQALEVNIRMKALIQNWAGSRFDSF